jgi:hypothetical protein
VLTRAGTSAAASRPSTHRPRAAEQATGLQQAEHDGAHEERNAPGSAYQHVAQLGRRRAAEHPRGKVTDRGGVQGGQLHQGQHLDALQRRQQLAQLLAGLVGPVRDQDQAAAARERAAQVVQ